MLLQLVGNLGCLLMRVIVRGVVDFGGSRHLLMLMLASLTLPRESGYGAAFFRRFTWLASQSRAPETWM